jgi:hypothetical protein
MIFVGNLNRCGNNSLNYSQCLEKSEVGRDCILCEVITILIAFHGSGARTFKDFYTLTVLPH